MTRVLVVTVGGSPDPVKHACKDYEAEYVYFITSESTQAVAETVARQLRIPENCYDIRVVRDPDNLEEVYGLLEAVDEEVQEKFPGAEKAINYTGGTKTMTSGAVIFGTYHLDWKLGFQHGTRHDNVAVKGGDQWKPVDVLSIYVKGQFRIYADLLSKYHYGTVDWLISRIQRGGDLPEELYDKISKLRNCCRAFEAWDRFDHKKALEFLNLVRGEFMAKWIKLAKHLTGQMRDTDPYLKVVDLIANSERRFAQGRYDDGIARLYRALEWLAQIRLRTKYGIDSNDVNLELVPEQLREQFHPRGSQAGKVRIDLVKDYRLLAALGDELGDWWQANERQLIGNLEVRNHSILAHGEKPITDQEYLNFRDTIVEFIKKGLEICGSKAEVIQLPTRELLEI